MKARTSSRSEKRRDRSRIRLERYPLPKSTEAICSQIREVLKGGNVVNLEMSIDNTMIRVMRMVSAEELEEDSLSWDSALQAVENMIEYSSEDASAYQVLVDMMQLVSSEGLHGLCWACGTNGQKLIQRWLEFEERGMPVTDPTLLGLPIREIKTMPAETLVLCAAPWASGGPEEISFAVKTVMELKHGKSEQGNRNLSGSPSSHPIGNGADQRASTVGGLAITSRGLRPVAWKSSGDNGGRVEDR